MTAEFVSVHVAGDRPGVGVIGLSRPARNTITRQVCREIVAACDEVSRRDEIVAVLVFGGHDIFSAGDDVEELRVLDPADAAAAVQLRQQAAAAIAAIPKPTVAAVTGYALGSGLALALAADRRISGDNAKFGCTEVLAGLGPGGGVSVRLPQLVGIAHAKDLVFSGRFVDAPEALAIGLIDEMVSPDGVYDAAADWAGRFAGRSVAALAGAKAALSRGDDTAALDRERQLYADVFAEADRRFVPGPTGR